MSLRVHTQGGGAGGASASIFITGLSETDTVTATKDGKTVKGKWVQKTLTWFDQPLIPTMTSNTTPSGVASASRYYSTCYPYLAFGGSGWEIAYTQYANTDDYLRYDFAEPVMPTSFILQSAKNVDGTVNVNVIVIYEDDTEEVVGSGQIPNRSVTITGDISVSRPIKAVKIMPTAFTTYYQVRVNSFQLYGIVETVVGGHEITPVKDYGMYTVTATNGEETTTQDVLVDAAVEYEIEMMYGFYTEFDEKEADWVESGGTFNYGNGLYVEYGSAKGTIIDGGNCIRRLDIPCYFKTFDLIVSGNVYEAAVSGAGGYHIRLLNESADTVVLVNHNDGWSNSTHQNADVQEPPNIGVEALFSAFYHATGYNGVDLIQRLTYDGKNLSYYVNGSLVGSAERNYETIKTVRIEVVGYSGNYTQIGVKLNSLSVRGYHNEYFSS